MATIPPPTYSSTETPPAYPMETTDKRAVEKEAAIRKITAFSLLIFAIIGIIKTIGLIPAIILCIFLWGKDAPFYSRITGWVSINDRSKKNEKETMADSVIPEVQEVVEAFGILNRLNYIAAMVNNVVFSPGKK